jgi:ABC-type nickel/cobalt efflux system permease component RcnA
MSTTAHRRPARRRAPSPPRAAHLLTTQLPPALANAAAALADFVAVPAQRDGCAALLAAVLALVLVKACDVAATRDWLDRVRVVWAWVFSFFFFCARSQPAPASFPHPVYPSIHPQNTRHTHTHTRTHTHTHTHTHTQKLTRKLVHTLAGPGFVLCWPLFR